MRESKSLSGILFATLIACHALDTRGQEPFPQARPEDLGLLLPQAPLREGGGRRVLVKDHRDQIVVGKIHVVVGDYLVVLLPDGRLMSVSQNAVTPTTRPFEPLGKDAVIKTLARDFPGFKTGSTRRYVYVYNTSDAFYQATSRILETMYPSLFAYCQRQRLDVHDPETLLVVVMFRTEDEFQKYRKMPTQVLAYYNGVNNHVVMYEQPTLAEVSPTLAVKRSISTIAHEGVHQILHNIGVQQRLSQWPMWISEGLPDYFAPTDIGRRVKWKGVGLVNDIRMHSLIEHVKRQPAGIENGGLVRQTVAAQQLDVAGYAAAWALTHYLALNQRDEFIAYMRDVSQLEPSARHEGSNLTLFKKHFGDDFADIQTRMFNHLRKQPYVDPVANQPHYVAVVDGKKRTVLVTTSPSHVVRWHQETIAKMLPADRRRATFTVRVFANKTLADQAVRSVRGS